MYHGGGHVWRRYCCGYISIPLLEQSKKPKCPSSNKTDVIMAALYGKMLRKLCVFGAVCERTI